MTWDKIKLTTMKTTHKYKKWSGVPCIINYEIFHVPPKVEVHVFIEKKLPLKLQAVNSTIPHAPLQVQVPVFIKNTT
jgi:hypothetical protein